MSYGVSSALQAGVYQTLVADAALTTLLDSAIYDALPAGALPSLYAVIGPEVVRDASDKTGGGAVHDFTVAVVSEAAGFAPAKVAAAAISDVLTSAEIPLNRGILVHLSFYRARAARIGTGDRRQITLTFRARVADDT